jgi:hypothetical protein
MLLAPIVSRLQSSCPSLRQVINALSAAVPTSYPSAYVLPLAERMVEDTLSLSLRVYEARFGIEIMARNVAQAATGGDAGIDLEAVREEILAALVGYAPGNGYTSVVHVSGRLLSFEAGLAVWRDEFTVLFPR